MKRLCLVIIAILCAFMLTGCKSIDYGTVKDKSFSPAHKTYAPIVTRIGKTTRIFPRWIHHSDSWAILVENEEGKDWWTVSEDFYNSVDVGDTVDRRKDGATVSGSQ